MARATLLEYDELAPPQVLRRGALLFMSWLVKFENYSFSNVFLSSVGMIPQVAKIIGASGTTSHEAHYAR